MTDKRKHGGARPGAGRKRASPTGEARTASIQIPLTPSERATIDAAWGTAATRTAREVVMRAATRAKNKKDPG